MKIYSAESSYSTHAGQVKRNFEHLQNLENQRKLNSKHQNFLVTIPVGSELLQYTITDVDSATTAINLALYKCAREMNKEPGMFSRLHKSRTRTTSL